MQTLPTQFVSREELIAQVELISPWLSERNVSDIRGGNASAQTQLEKMEPLEYGKTRNYIAGKVTRLSPYIRHGILTLEQVRKQALKSVSEPKQIEKLIQELAWRDFWQKVYAAHPEWMWHDVEPYKTGFSSEDYSDHLPDDIAQGETGIACLDHFIRTLLSNRYIHNHARMYLASYVVHWRKVKWQAGAQWFLTHLLDGDVASNNLSWQWVASTFSNKPYIFNLENVTKYATGTGIDCSPENNAALAASYEELAQQLFPNQGGAHA